MQKADGMRYAPKGRVQAVCGRGDFRFAAIGLDHGHIYGMCNGLVEAGSKASRSTSRAGVSTAWRGMPTSAGGGVLMTGSFAW